MSVFDFLYLVCIYPYLENLPFECMKINEILYEITITYEGDYVKVSIELRNF